jgi:hypothetical protein
LALEPSLVIAERKLHAKRSSDTLSLELFLEHASEALLLANLCGLERLTEGFVLASDCGLQGVAASSAAS